MGDAGDDTAHKQNAAATKPGYVSLTNKSEPLNPKKGLLAGALSLCSIL